MRQAEVVFGVELTDGQFSQLARRALQREIEDRTQDVLGVRALSRLVADYVDWDVRDASNDAGWLARNLVKGLSPNLELLGLVRPGLHFNSFTVRYCIHWPLPRLPTAPQLIAFLQHIDLTAWSSLARSFAWEWPEPRLQA